MLYLVNCFYKSTYQFLTLFSFIGSNILHDGKSNIKIGDFGVARLTEPEATEQAISKIDEVEGRDTQFAGTVHWMAPEALSGERYGRKADIW